jgi:hypothetical protein
MARIFEVKDLQEKRLALARESELYRHALTVELTNLGRYRKEIGSAAERQEQNQNAVFNSAPIIKLLLPLIAGWLRRGKKRGKFSRLLSFAILGWQTYHKFRPIIRTVNSLRSRTNLGNGPNRAARPAVIL